MKWCQAVMLSLVILTVSGCSLRSRLDYPPMAVPLQMSAQQEIQIARLTQLLQRKELDGAIRAAMLFERGALYDIAGLRELARIDFTQSLAINPAQSHVFNLLGMYYTQIGEYDAAYEAFDSTIELKPENDYAKRNRAIALYYGGRTELALEEITEYFQEDTNDAFRVLWLYIIKNELFPSEAKAELLASYHAYLNRPKSEDEQVQWGWSLIALTLGKVTDKQMLSELEQRVQDDNTLFAQRLTEAYFYLAKRYQQNKEYEQAIALYKLAISFNIHEYVEHRYAFIELSKIYKAQEENNE